MAADEMRDVIVTHLILWQFVAVLKTNRLVVTLICINMLVMGERVWGVQRRSLFAWNSWIRGTFVASRVLIIVIYAGMAVVWWKLICR